jgi:hypothetical protein
MLFEHGRLCQIPCDSWSTEFSDKPYGALNALEILEMECRYLERTVNSGCSVASKALKGEAHVRLGFDGADRAAPTWFLGKRGKKYWAKK